jgi:hypothetical protein
MFNSQSALPSPDTWIFIILCKRLLVWHYQEIFCRIGHSTQKREKQSRIAKHRKPITMLKKNRMSVLINTPPASGSFPLPMCFLLFLWSLTLTYFSVAHFKGRPWKRAFVCDPRDAGTSNFCLLFSWQLSSLCQPVLTKGEGSMVESVKLTHA